MWQLQQTEPLAISWKRASGASRVYSTKTQSLCAGSAPWRLRMIAISPMKSAPGRIASLTTIVPFGNCASALRRCEAKTFFVPSWDRTREEGSGRR